MNFSFGSDTNEQMFRSDIEDLGGSVELLPEKHDTPYRVLKVEGLEDRREQVLDIAAAYSAIAVWL